MIRFGLCCLFKDAPIKFYTTTAAAVRKLSRKDALKKISDLCLKNALSLQQAIRYCHQHQIGSFRINSKILPLKTHPEFGYDVKKLPDGREIINQFCECQKLMQNYRIRLSFHPDQYILLSSSDSGIIKRSIDDLEYHAQISDWVGADVINIHGGGAYNNKKQALLRVAKNLKRLSSGLRKRLTFENDDTVYTPKDLLPLCLKEKIPFVYDVHHHRCLLDGLTVEDVTQQALKTWPREPLFHISSPKQGWSGPDTYQHHDYIDINDFPRCWKNLDITIDIEAKAKELAVKKFINDLKS